MERNVQKKQKHSESLDTEKPLKPKKVEKIDAALRMEPVQRVKPHKTHDSGPHPGPVMSTPVEEPTPYQYDTDPTYCWGDGGVNSWTIVTQFKEGELPLEYEAGMRKNRRTYARKWKYEYCEFKLEMVGKEGWDKLAAANALLRRRRGKILVLDPDAVIMNMGISLDHIEKKYRNDKDILFPADLYQPRGEAQILNSSITSSAMMIFSGVWVQNFFLKWLLFLQDDGYMKHNFTQTGWSDTYHGILDKDQTGLLTLRKKEPVEWELHVEVIPWNVFSSPYPPPVDQGDMKWGSDPTWRFKPGDFILHPHGRHGVHATVYRALFSSKRSCVLTGEGEFPCQASENESDKFELSFPTYLGMTTEEWAAHTGNLKENGFKYGIPVLGVLVAIGWVVSWYLRRKSGAEPRV